MAATEIAIMPAVEPTNTLMTAPTTITMAPTNSHLPIPDRSRLITVARLAMTKNTPAVPANAVMISWVPFLGKEGLFNSALLATGAIDQPLEFLLFSDFAVILTYVNLFTLFMLAPIFNSMAKIDRNVIEAALDAGATHGQILRDVIIPLSRTGIALGSIFVLTLVMGDFFIVRVMSGGQSTSVVSAMKNNIDQLYYPQAAAMAVLLIGVVLLLVSLILRVVDVRSELAK